MHIRDPRRHYTPVRRWQPLTDAEWDALRHCHVGGLWPERTSWGKLAG